MSRERWERLGRLLEEALGLEPEERRRFLARASADDPALGPELASLVEAHGRPGPLDRPAPEWMASALADVGSDEDPDHPGEELGPYRVGERVGGVLGSVYRAYDDRLGRDVALKLLPLHMSADPVARARFLREARSAASLEHPNICTILDTGQTDDGRLYLVMPFYRGETLEELLARGPLPVETALGLALQVARGLAAAHGRGIVHRDVKPGNIMVTEDGGARVMDFGVAKLAGATLTGAGARLGTAAYMSPEQVRGEEVDARSDVWALGAALYEMLAGERPFRGETALEVLSAILHSHPRPIAELRPEVPAPVAKFLDRMLAVDPADRPRSMEEVVAALEGAGAADLRMLSGSLAARLPLPVRWPWKPGRRRVGHRRRRSRSRGRSHARTGPGRAALIAGGLAVVGLGGLGLWLAGMSGGVDSDGSGELPERILIADFANFTSDSLLGYVVSQALRIDLSRSPLLNVAGAPAVAGALERMRREPDTRLDSRTAREVAVREGIPLVIGGEVRGAGSGFVFSAEIIDAGSGEIVDGWREGARDATHILDAIDRLSKALRERVQRSLGSTKTGDSPWRFTTSSLEALRNHAQGYRLFQRGDYLRSAALFREAIRLDSAFAVAHLDVAWALLQAEVERGEALRALARGYELRDRLTVREGHEIAAKYLQLVVGDLKGAIEAFHRQIEAARPLGESRLYASLGSSLVLAGDFAAAESVLREAWSVYPTPVNQATLVKVLYRRGKAAEAEATLHRAMQRFPDHPLLQRLQVELMAGRGEWGVADSLAREVRPGGSVGLSHRQVGLFAVLRGQLERARGELRALMEGQISRGLYANATEVAAALGRIELIRADTQRAVRELDELLERHPLESLDPLDRPYLPLARFLADAGQSERARDLLAGYEQDVPQAFRGPDRQAYFRARAAIHLAEAKAKEAVADLRRARAHPPIRGEWFQDPYVPSLELPEVGRGYELMGHPDSAIAAYERYLAERTLTVTEIAFDLPEVLGRLATLHEAWGDRDAAALHSARFVELWSEADAELQPEVREARQRAEAMRGSANLRDSSRSELP